MTLADDMTTSADAVLEGLSLIDCDAHFTEPADLWTARVPAAMHDKVPVLRTNKARSAWFLGEDMMMHTGGNTLRRGASGVEKVLGTPIIANFDDIDPSAWDVKQRLALMDEMGVHAQVLYPNAVGFASNTMFWIEDIEQRSLIQRVYNDFLIDIQKESGNRLLPQAVLPVWDMDATLAEMARLRDAGISGFTVSDKPHTVGLPDIDAPYFAPMWALGNEMDAVFSFHIASGATRNGTNVQKTVETGNAISAPNPDLYFESYGPQRRLAIMATSFYMANARIISNLCMGDFFDKYPQIKIFSAESGIGWVPFLLEAMEYQLDEMVTDPAELSLQKRRPTEYFRDHIFVSFWFEKVGPAKLVEDIGVNNVMLETDIPHPTCIYPQARERLAAAVAPLSPEVRRRVVQDNAAELFKVTLPDKG